MKARLEYLNEFLSAMGSVWVKLEGEIDAEIATLTARLIAKEDEQIRGSIKALIKLKGLRETLDSERKHIAATLSE